MLGAIAGDIIGSPYERGTMKSTEFPLFQFVSRPTDDSVLTIALAEHILTGKNYVDLLHDYFHRYPDAGFGGTFFTWAARREREPYNSWGNGSAMRVSPVGWAYETIQEVLDAARDSAAVTHNHPEGIKGASAIAAAVFLARKGHSKADIREFVTEVFGYDLTDTVENLRRTYAFDVSCQGSVPQAVIAFLASENFEDAVRTAISLGGDSDTIGCMTGGIAQAYYGGVPDAIKAGVYDRLDPALTEVVRAFTAKYHCE